MSPAVADAALIVPTGHPVVDGVGRATQADVNYALLRATRFLVSGGDVELVRGYVDEWLDYALALELKKRVGM